nr:hypothetical protein [uncultured Cohaesibacter sp.]
MSRTFCMNLATLALMTTALLSGLNEANAAPQGYSITDTDKSYSIVLNGETVFEIGFDIGMVPFEIDGPRDMNGNGVLDLTVLWMNSRSTAAFAVFEFWPEELGTLFKTSGPTQDMLQSFSKLSDADIAALVSGEMDAPSLRPHGLLTLPEGLKAKPQESNMGSQGTGLSEKMLPLGNAATDELPMTNGFWSYKQGNLDEGTSAMLGWKDPDLSENTYSFIQFKCRENGDDTWVMPMYAVEERTNTEKPDRLRFILDGKAIDIWIWWAFNDETGYYEPMGSLPRDTDFFERLSRADEVVMQCGDISPDTLDGPAGDADEMAAIRTFMQRCN